jgi:uncharacterized membrane protein
MQARTRKEDAIKKLGNLFLQGLIAILPIVATLAILFWLGTFTEAFLGGIIKIILPASWYWPGMGFLAGVAVVLIVGLLVDAYVFQRFGAITEGILMRIPIVKTIYNGVRDIAQFLTPSEERKDTGTAVMVRIADDMRVIGFVTGTKMPYECEEESVVVYMPMSYQIGGYTVYMPKSRIEPLNMPVEQAMRMVLTAGMNAEQAQPSIIQVKNGHPKNGHTKK